MIVPYDKGHLSSPNSKKFPLSTVKLRGKVSTYALFFLIW
jgi:hypothetical protein